MTVLCDTSHQLPHMDQGMQTVSTLHVSSAAVFYGHIANVHSFGCQYSIEHIGTTLWPSPCTCHSCSLAGSHCWLLLCLFHTLHVLSLLAVMMVSPS